MRDNIMDNIPTKVLKQRLERMEPRFTEARRVIEREIKFREDKNGTA